MGFFDSIKKGLSRTRDQIGAIIGGSRELDDAFFERLEEAMIAADIGCDFSIEIIEELRQEVKSRGIKTAEETWELLKNIVAEMLSVKRDPDDFPPKPWVILVVGVNGVGKTTTIGKLSNELRQQGRSVTFGAADTFRAGAIEQLKIWADRTGACFIAQAEGADPAAVAFDAVEAAKARGSDVCILDTAGRLHNKVNLMNELEKISRVVKRALPSAPNEVLLVVDATTGQNAIRQAEVFNSIAGLTGLVITKLDGTAKGGIALALARKFRLPIRKIGVGEGINDLQDFDAKQYAESLFGDLPA